MTREDAEAIVIPHICLPSKDEPEDMIKVYTEVLGNKGVVDQYHDSPHGWMGARADLSKENEASDYDKG